MIFDDLIFDNAGKQSTSGFRGSEEELAQTRGPTNSYKIDAQHTSLNAAHAIFT